MSLPFLEAIKARGAAPPSAGIGQSKFSLPPKAEPPKPATPAEQLAAAAKARANKTTASSAPAPVPRKAPAKPLTTSTTRNVDTPTKPMPPSALKKGQPTPSAQPHPPQPPVPPVSKEPVTFALKGTAPSNNLLTEAKASNPSPAKKSSIILSDNPIYRNVPVASQADNTMPISRPPPRAETPPPVCPKPQAAAPPPKPSSSYTPQSNSLQASRSPVASRPLLTASVTPDRAPLTRGNKKDEGVKMHKRGRFQIIVDNERIVRAFSHLVCKVV